MKTDKGLSNGAKQADLNFELTRTSVLLTDLPIPPSSNHQYKLFRRGKKTYHVPSDELKVFKATMEQYPFRFPGRYVACRNMIAQWLEQKKLLEIHCHFFFKESRIFTQKHEPKKFDVSNRLKALHDSISSLLGIDDKSYFRIFAEKCICSDKLGEMVCVEIFPMR